MRHFKQKKIKNFRPRGASENVSFGPAVALDGPAQEYAFAVHWMI